MPQLMLSLLIDPSLCALRRVMTHGIIVKPHSAILAAHLACQTADVDSDIAVAVVVPKSVLAQERNK